MLEAAAAICAGLGVTASVFAIALPPPASVDEYVAPSWLTRHLRRIWTDESALAAAAGWTGSGATRLVVAVQVVGGVAGACAAAALTGLPVLAVAGAAGAVALVRGGFAARMRSRQVRRPLFDMLAAAVLVQGPGGGELAPLFADLEASVSAAQEVEREARALQVQARSAASIIVSLPVVFLVVLSALRSPYLDAYHNPTGQAFLLAMLAVMACSYVWMRRLLILPGLQRVRLIDA